MEIKGTSVYKRIQKLSRLQLQQVIIQVNAELDQCKQKLKKYEDDYHYSQLNELKKENQTLKAQIQEKTEEMERRENELQKKLQEQVENNLKKKDYKKKIDTLESENKTLKEKLLKHKEDFQREQKKHEKVLQQLKEENERFQKESVNTDQLTGEIAELQKMVQTLNEEVDLLREKNKESANQLTAVMEERDQRLQAERDRYEQLKKQFNQIQEENEEAIRQVMNEEINQLKEMVHSYSDKLTSSTRIIHELQMKIEELKTELNNHRST